MTDLLVGAKADNDEPLQGHARVQLDALFRTHGQRLVRILTQRAGGREEARDLVQEAFLRLTRAAEAQVLVNPEFYLKRITRNLLRDRAKSIAGAVERTHVAFEPEVHAANDGDPHNILEARQTLARYEAAVLRLKPRTREIYLLHRLDGLSYAQIATDLHLSVSAIEKHMMKAIAHIDRVINIPQARPPARP